MTERPLLQRLLSRAELLACGLIVLLAVGYAADIQRRLGVSVYDAQLLAGALGLALVVGFVSLARKAASAAMRWLWILLAGATLAVSAYIAVTYVELSMEAPFSPLWLVGLTGVLCGALVLNLKPAAGLGILAVVAAFVGYGLFGHLFPGEFASREIYPSELILYLALDANGILGTALKVAVVIVVPYLLFGQLLASCGAAQFFNDVALAAMGRFRGGPAKVAVAASALFGSISGSAVGNVVGTGVVTIPMMKRAGFPAPYAAAVEAVASTGGQLVPPVMGAAAFIMADFIGADYVDVMLAALPAALLYYAAILINVDLRAARRGIDRLSEAELPRAGAALRAGWHFVLPFGALFYALFALNMRPERAAVLAIVVLLLGSAVFGYKGQRIRLREILDTIGSAGRAAVDLIIVCAAAGVIIGILNLSGLAFNLTLHIIAASGDNVVLLALITALISIVLGMGMPTVGVYILLATLVAPALVESGVPVMAAHLFVFYFGLLSMVTPPVALAAFAAANVAGTDSWRTCVESMRLAWPAYIVPFLFLFAPSLTFEGTILQVTWALASALLGIWMVTAGLVGYVRSRLGMPARALLVVGGLLSLMPAGLFEGGIWTDVVGFAALGAALALRPPPEPATEHGP